MTLYSIIKAWKTSTGLAISLLTATILLLSIYTAVDLSDLATFGLFFVALQALHFTNEQVKEWRRKEALNHCYEAERLYKKIKPLLNYITHAAFENNNAKEKIYQKKIEIDHNAENHNIENYETFNRLITEIRMVYIHLEEMDKEPAQDLLGLLINFDCAIFLADLQKFGCEEDETQNLQEQLLEIKSLAKEAGIKGKLSVDLMLDSYIHELKFVVVEK